MFIIHFTLDTFLLDNADLPARMLKVLVSKPDNCPLRKKEKMKEK